MSSYHRTLLALSITTASLFTLATQAAPESCANIYDQGLNEAQTAALVRANEGDYKVHIMSGVIKGQKRTVVLVGESHRKSQTAKDVGQDLLKEFTFRGLEGAQANLTWGGRTLNWAMRASYSLGNLLALGRRGKTSTILDANRDALLQDAVDQLSALIKSGRITEEDLSSVSVTIAGEKISVGELRERLKGNGSTKRRSRLKTVDLEEGHRPELAENLQSILFPATAFSCVSAACTAAVEYVAPGHVINHAIQDVSIGIFVITDAQYFGSQILGKWYGENGWYKYVFSLNTGLVDGRNRTMSKNIKRALEENGDDTLLVIVGRNHLAGLKQLLKASYGFEEAALSKEVAVR